MEFGSLPYASMLTLARYEPVSMTATDKRGPDDRDDVTRLPETRTNEQINKQTSSRSSLLFFLSDV